MTMKISSDFRTKEAGETSDIASDDSGESSMQESDKQPEHSTTTSCEERYLTVLDALRFLDAIKARFPDNIAVYESFLDLMKDFRTGVVDAPRVADRVSSLFVGHSDLIEGFGQFLPSEIRIEHEIKTAGKDGDIRSGENGHSAESAHGDGLSVSIPVHGLKLDSKPKYPLYRL